MDISKIENKKELDEALNIFRGQGFSIGATDHIHDSKIRNIIETANVHKLDIRFNHQNDFIEDNKLDTDNILRKLYFDKSDYDVIEQRAKDFFRRFSVGDKVKELLNKFNLESDEVGTLPSKYSPSWSDISSWYKFKTKYEIDDGGNFHERCGDRGNVHVYNLDKKSIKINGLKKWDGLHEFRKLYVLFYGQEPLPFDVEKYGEWQNLGEIELKTYKNGTTELRGNLTKMKEEFFKRMKEKIWMMFIIFYNNQKIVLERDPQYI